MTDNVKLFCIEVSWWKTKSVLCFTLITKLPWPSKWKVLALVSLSASASVSAILSLNLLGITIPGTAQSVPERTDPSGSSRLCRLQRLSNNSPSALCVAAQTQRWHISGCRPGVRRHLCVPRWADLVQDSWKIETVWGWREPGPREKASVGTPASPTVHLTCCFIGNASVPSVQSASQRLFRDVSWGNWCWWCCCSLLGHPDSCSAVRAAGAGFSSATREQHSWF